MLSIKDDDKFEFKAVVPVANEQNATVFAINYVSNIGLVNIVLEGMSLEGADMIAKKEITYGEFKEAFPKHRVYLQGYIEV